MLVGIVEMYNTKTPTKWSFFTCCGLWQTPQHHPSSCGTIFILQCRSKLQLMALNRSPTLLIDHRCSHPTRQFFNYNHIAHHGEGSQHYAVTHGVGRLRHDGTALIFVAVASTLMEGRWSMVVIRFLSPGARPLLNPAKPNQPVLLGDHSWEDAMWLDGASVAFLGTKRSPRIYFTPNASVADVWHSDSLTRMFQTNPSAGASDLPPCFSGSHESDSFPERKSTWSPLHRGPPGLHSAVQKFS